MEKLIILYIVVSVIYNVIGFIIAYKQLMNKIEGIDVLKGMKQMFLQSAQIKLLKSKIWNWYTILFLGVPLFIFISPFLFPLSLFKLIKKTFGYKSKLQKESEIEEKLMQDSQKKSEEFMKNEGDINPFINEIIPEPEIEIERTKILTYDELFSIFERVEKLKESIKDKENDLMGEIVKKEPQAFRTYTLKEILERDNLTEFRPEARKELFHVSNELRLIFEELKE